MKCEKHGYDGMVGGYNDECAQCLLARAVETRRRAAAAASAKDAEIEHLRAEMAQLRAAQSGDKHAREIRLMQAASERLQANHVAALARKGAEIEALENDLVAATADVTSAEMALAETERLQAENARLRNELSRVEYDLVYAKAGASADDAAAASNESVLRHALKQAGLIHGDEVVQQVNGIEDSAKEAAQTASRLSRDINLMRAACEYLVGLIKGAKPSREGE